MFSTQRLVLFKAMFLTSCVVYFVYIFSFSLLNKDAKRNSSRTFMDLEQSLCSYKINKTKSLKQRKCPEHGIVTVQKIGRFGNNMWEYASVWAAARKTGLKPYVPRCIRQTLDPVFASLTVPTLDEISHCPVDIKHFARSLKAWNDTKQNLMLPFYAIEPELVMPWVEDIVQEFSFRKELLDQSQQILHLASKNKTDCVFVSVHVRRTDYIHHLMSLYAASPANATFFRLAMQYFEVKYQCVVFVVVSDDYNMWCETQFSGKENAYITRNNSFALDLAVMASCNHSIFDYGTFGHWAAILAGGETIYYNITQEPSKRIAPFMHNWFTL